MSVTQPMPADNAATVHAISSPVTLVMKTATQALPTAAKSTPKPMKPTAEAAAMCVTRTMQPVFAQAAHVRLVHATAPTPTAMAALPMAVK